MKRSIKVVGAIIENENDEILCALRSPRMSRPNLWEFPGGKVEKEEIIKEAVVREIMEELGCNVEFKSVFSDTIHEYDDMTVNLITVKCRLISGSLTATEHSKVIWLKRESLTSLIWAPADMDAVNKLIKEGV